jgi:hypothetical protein
MHTFPAFGKTLGGAVGVGGGGTSWPQNGPPSLAPPTTSACLSPWSLAPPASSSSTARELPWSDLRAESPWR